MHEKLIRSINTQLAERLSARRLPFAPTRRSVQALLRAPSWTQGLEELLPLRGRLSCAQVLELCGDILPQLSPQAPEDGTSAPPAEDTPPADAPEAKKDDPQ